MQALTQHLVEIAAAVIAAVVVLLARKAMAYFEAKSKIDIPANFERMIEEWAEKGIDYAEEKAHQAVKKAEVLDGNTKLNVAVEFVTKLAEEHGIKEIAKDKLVSYIEARLGARR